MGGQGGGVLVDWIVAMAEARGFCAQSTSVPGVAQRTGATLYYVELLAPPPGGFAGRIPVLSLMPTPGEVDLLVGAELMEAGRGILRGLASPERTMLIASTHRALAVSEKIGAGDGAGDPWAVLDAAAAAARRVVAFDMASLAEQSGSVISAVLFGAIAGAGGLPFPRAAYEAAITETGIGVAASLRAFAAGFAAAAEPRVPAPAERPRPRHVPLAHCGHRALDALAARVRLFPDPARAMVATGLRRVVDFQDPAYGREYLDHVATFLPFDDENGALTNEAARQIAVAMTYNDVFRVADQKTRSGRHGRIRDEVAAAAAQVVHTTEYLHPGVPELCGLLPPRWGAALERSPFAARVLGRLSRGRHVGTMRLRGFFPLYVVAGLRRFRRGTLRHSRERAQLLDWLDRARAAAAADRDLALEVLRARRLVKGYSDTRARGGKRFDTLMQASERLAGRPDAAAWMRRLREAALRDVSGDALTQTLRTVETFMAENGR